MAPATHRNSLKPGYRLHWYRIDDILGQGGFGITYLAHDTNLDQPVAIKEYLPVELAVRESDASVQPVSSAGEEQFRWGLERFIEEARTLARFRHPGIVRVASVFEENHTAYMIMAYERGKSLQEILVQEDTLEEDQLRNIVAPLLDGLEKMHAAGFIHRDINPKNIYVRDDQSAVLLDFGAARHALGQATRTLTSIVSPGYAPFEQYFAKSDKQGPWTDIYGLGATLYRSVTGRTPQSALERSDAILQHQQDNFAPATDLVRGHYSDGFLNAIDHALQFTEEKRPQTVDEWRAELLATASVTRDTNIDPGRTFVHLDAVTGEISSDDVAAGAGSATSNANPLAQVSANVSAASSATASASPSSTAAILRASQQASAAFPPRRKSGRSLRIVAWLMAALFVWVGVSIGLPRYLATLAVDERKNQQAPEKRSSERAISVESDDFDDVAARHERTVASLVDRARLAINTDRITEPTGDNALEYYQKILELQPGHKAAEIGIRDIVDTLVKAAGRAAARDDFPTAQSMITQALELEPGSEQLALARRELDEQVLAWNDNRNVQERNEVVLKAADVALREGRLSSPAGDNALQRYQVVLDADPANAAARAGVSKVVDAHVRQANAAIDEGQLDEAREAIRSAHEIMSEAGNVKLAWQRLREAEGTQQGYQTGLVEVEKLLNQAEEDIAALRLTNPPGNNAVMRFREVLEIDPLNREAQRGLEILVEKYVTLTNQALASGNRKQAAVYVDRARAILPDSPAVKLAEQSLKRGKASKPRSAPTPSRASSPPAKPALKPKAEPPKQFSEAQPRRLRDAEARRLYREAELKEVEEALKRH